MRSELINVQISIPELFNRPLVQSCESIFARDLRFQHRAELRLSARSLHEHDMLTGNGHRQIAAKVLLHEREGEVDTGCNAGRRPDWSVFDIDRILLDLYAGVLLLQHGAMRPMGNHAATFGQTRCSKESSSRTNGTDPSRASS